MIKLTLKERIIRYLHKSGGWVNSGKLERLAIGAGYKGGNCGRRLRELVEEGKLEVRYVKSKRGPKVAEYKYKDTPHKAKTGELSSEEMVKYSIGAK